MKELDVINLLSCKNAKTLKNVDKYLVPLGELKTEPNQLPQNFMRMRTSS